MLRKTYKPRYRGSSVFMKPVVFWFGLLAIFNDSSPAASNRSTYFGRICSNVRHSCDVQTFITYWPSTLEKKDEADFLTCEEDPKKRKLDPVCPSCKHMVALYRAIETPQATRTRANRSGSTSWKLSVFSILYAPYLMPFCKEFATSNCQPRGVSPSLLSMSTCAIALLTRIAILTAFWNCFFPFLQGARDGPRILLVRF
mmetsp:Transcript_66577/g.128840  ORF Transcript_66577/g.128840 Transcript_66577/m.128840 type:complete len:200 (+) Transcript_66577:703-1302(+)